MNGSLARRALANRYALAVSLLEEADWSLEDEPNKTPMDWRLARAGRYAAETV